MIATTRVKYLKCTDCKEKTNPMDLFIKEDTTKVKEVDNETFETIKEDRAVACWNCGGTSFYAIVEGID